MKKTTYNLLKKHHSRIETILTDLIGNNNLDSFEPYIYNLGSTISEIFNISDLAEHSEYMEILNEIDVYDKNLSIRIENYLIKEINLVAALGFHIAHFEYDKKNYGYSDEDKMVLKESETEEI